MEPIIAFIQSFWEGFIIWFGAIASLLISVAIAFREEFSRQSELIKSNKKAAELDPSFSESAKNNILNLNSFCVVKTAIFNCVFRNSLQSQIVLSVMLFAARFDNNQYLQFFLILMMLFLILFSYMYESTKSHEGAIWDAQTWFRSTIVFIWIALLTLSLLSYSNADQKVQNEAQSTHQRSFKNKENVVIKELDIKGQGETAAAEKK